MRMQRHRTLLYETQLIWQNLQSQEKFTSSEHHCSMLNFRTGFGYHGLFCFSIILDFCLLWYNSQLLIFYLSLNLPSLHLCRLLLVNDNVFSTKSLAAGDFLRSFKILYTTFKCRVLGSVHELTNYTNSISYIWMSYCQV